MKLQIIDTGFFKLDGGAMFGVVPKTLWSKHNPADDRNLCTWAMRCLLVENGNRLLLVDTGMGDKQDARFFSFYEPHGEASLLTSIHQAGYSEKDITDVLLTHLHFDHVGGAVYRASDRLLPTFSAATYWSHSEHWQWATHPNPREKASFLKENMEPLQESGQLQFLDKNSFAFPNVDLRQVDGHTEKMTLPIFKFGDRTIAYVADLIPSSAHIALPWIMSYDVRPLLTLEEKTRLLQQAADGNWILVFEHDPLFEAATVEATEKGIRIRDKGSLSSLL
ncbi:MBL fold metallo-hydrolase [Larkinella terrae]|uniref:MBL fold metallo-hydrolase n=1 Tax=Larkinella terrae TaxID=2025311 RepID=A0A7K0EV99_9BACT|nr:MBL fold metallo-hydrolase [Larkinella terrae]MRS65744.1 MBL fold metallo-hydrolase [Larkinella terrae]